MALWDFEEHIVGRKGGGGFKSSYEGNPQRVGTFFMAGIFS